MGALTLVSPRTDADVETGRQLFAWVRSRKPDALFNVTHERVTLRFRFQGEADLTLGLDCLTAWDIRQLERNKLPPLYSSGIVYEREILCTHDGVTGICEEWWTALELHKRKSGDCEDLSSLRSAELILSGEQARARAKRSKIGWHIQVHRADGTIEDPSAKLGM
jgi:hypothetical protein